MKKSEQNLISVIIPTFNSEDNIKSCLQSIISQTNRNFEIIIIDGGSTDETLQKISECVPDNIKIGLLSEKDNGIYDAMNKGINKANGEWLLFLGSDDRIYQNDVFDQFIKATEQNIDIYYGNVYRARYKEPYDGEFNKDKLLIQNICHQAIFFNKLVFQRIGKFNLKYNVLADWDHNLRWFFSKKVKNKYIDLTIAEYAEGGLSSVATDVVFQENKPFKVFVYKGKGLNCINKLKHIRRHIREAFKKGQVRIGFRYLLLSYKIFF